MKINAQLDVNLVAHETEDEVAVLLELEAPAVPADVTRPQASLQVVLDRSGSMQGAPLEGAKKALVALVRRLEPTDNFGLVTFDNEAQVVVPAGPLTDKDGVLARIQSIVAGGSTDLSAGYLRGLRELRRVATAGGQVTETSPRREKFQRAFVRYGVPGVSLLGPLLLPTQLTSAMLAGAGVTKGRILVWQAIAITMWTTIATLIVTGVWAFAGILRCRKEAPHPSGCGASAVSISRRAARPR